MLAVVSFQPSKGSSLHLKVKPCRVVKQPHAARPSFALVEGLVAKGAAMFLNGTKRAAGVLRDLGVRHAALNHVLGFSGPRLSIHLRP